MAKKVLLFLAQGFEAYEASVFTDVFGRSREAGFEHAYFGDTHPAISVISTQCFY